MLTGYKSGNHFQHASQWMRAITFLVMAVSASATVFFNREILVKPDSFDIFNTGWFLSPYVFMGVLLISVGKLGKVHYLWYVLSICESAFGVYALVDIIYWHPDPQGAIAIFMVPILQGISALVLSLPIFWWVSR